MPRVSVEVFTMGGSSYAREVSVLPEHRATQVKQVLKIAHRGDGVGEKSNEMRKRNMRDAIC